MSILTIILVITGLLLLGGLIYYYRDYLKDIFKRNKKKIGAAIATTALLGTGGAGLYLETTPGSYVPTNQSLKTTDDVEFNNITIPDTINMSDATQTWHIYINATGVLVWEMI